MKTYIYSKNSNGNATEILAADIVLEIDRNLSNFNVVKNRFGDLHTAVPMHLLGDFFKSPGGHKNVVWTK